MNLKRRLKREYAEFRVLLRSIPAVPTALFIVAVVAMNLLANKSINLDVSFLALDCGILVSWFAFLIMDVLTKHFGPKAATEISLLAIAVNLAVCFVLFLGSVIPGTWGESYVEGSEEVINSALDSTFGGVWYVLLGSTLAFIVSSVVNNFSNYAVGKLFKNPDGAAAYFVRSYVSTAVGQFLDNFIFALTVSHVFFGWSLLQCVTCALTGMVVELICEAVFSGFGFTLSKKWRKNEVGKEYFEFIKEKK